MAAEGAFAVAAPGVGAMHDFAPVLDKYGLSYASRGVWLVVGRAQAAYGWKLHLSSVQVKARRLLDEVLPILRNEDAAFKIANGETVLGLLNEGALGHTQVGKFATIYPSNPAAAIRLARALVAATELFVGPRIVTDRHLGGVVYARYGPFSPPMQRNRLGLFSDVPSDEAIAAGYSIPFVPPEGIDDPFANFVQHYGGVNAGNNAPGPIGPGYLIVRQISAHAKGCVYEALDLRCRESVATVVLKEGRIHCMSDLHGRAMAERLANQAEAHRIASAVGVAPAAFAAFSHGDSLFLPIEHVPGRDLGARPATPFGVLPEREQEVLLRELCAAAIALEGLHGAGVIHRDLSMRNIRVRNDGTVALLDFEIAHIEAQGDPAKPLMQGTPGFVSPQQLSGAPPSVEDDLYGFGAVMVCALAGLDPQRVLFAHSGMDPDARALQIRELSGASEDVSRIAARCVAPTPRERPALLEVIGALERAAGQGRVAKLSKPWFEAERVHDLVIEGARWLLDGAIRDPDSRIWKSPEIEANSHADIRLVNAFRVYRSSNVGASGVVYLLSKLTRLGFPIDGVGTALPPAVDWLLAHWNTPDDQLPGLHFGETGVALTITETMAAGIIEPGPWTRPYFSEVFAASIDWPDLTHGAAGQGLGALACLQLMPTDPDLKERADACVARCARYLCDTQAEDGSWVLPDGVAEMSGKAYTGLAHGAAGVLSFLAHPGVPGADARAAGAADRAANWLMREARAGQGGLHLWWHMSPAETQSWTWWCHGGPGIAKGLLAQYAASGNKLCAAAARAALRSQPFEARHANLSQCHGLAGIGELYLEAYAVLSEDEWLDRAHAIARVLVNLARRDRNGASWLVENPYVPTPDLMIGTAGVVHFLARLLRRGTGFAAPLCPT